MQSTKPVSLGVNALPTSHVTSLAEIESGYWWFCGRTHWATKLASAALQNQNIAPEKATYLDLGCGTGGFANSLNESLKFRRTFLVDGDPKVLELAARYPAFQAEYRDLSNEFTLPGDADLFSCMDVIEHLPNDELFLKRLYSQMKQGSSLILSVPAYPSLYTEWDRLLGHYRRYTPRHLRSIFKAAGFSIEFLSPMWSFLTPAAPIRKLRSKRYQESMEFEKVPTFINQALVLASKLEWIWARRLPLPFGTSLIAWVTRK